MEKESPSLWVTRLGLCLGLLGLGVPLAGCGSGGHGGGDTPDGITVKSSSLTRDGSPSDAHVTDLGAGNTRFALDLYRELEAKNDDNLFFSPYSIAEALAMAYAGARGTTQSEMHDTLHIFGSDADFHEAWNATDRALASRAETSTDDKAVFKLNVANSIWAENTFDLEAPFLDTLATNYGAAVYGVDFIGAPEPSRLAINDWVAERTEDRIKDLIPKFAITSDTRLVLTNAIYFNANWADQFAPAQTKKAEFTTLGGDTVSVDTMARSAEAQYAEGEGYRATTLRYAADGLDMLVILPDAGSFDDFEASLDEAKLAEVAAALQPAEVDLTMPKFSFRSAFSVKEALQALGMNAAFGDADFSGINSQEGVAITDVIHQGFVNVNEEGTEAAAATAVIFGDTAAPTPQELHLDRPFIFAIRDAGTGEVLFLGRVTNPTL